MRQMAQGCGVVGVVTLAIGAAWVTASMVLATALGVNPGLMLMLTFPVPAVLSIVVALFVANRH